MRGMSAAMGKPVSGYNLSLTLQGLAKNYSSNSNASSSSSSSLNNYHQHIPPPVSEFTCACAPGWTGPTCEISKFYMSLL